VSIQPAVGNAMHPLGATLTKLYPQVSHQRQQAW